MAGTGFDKYLVQEGFNTVFSELRNMEAEARPSKKGFWGPNFWFRKRDGLLTQKDKDGNGTWDTLGNIVTSKIFNGKIYTYTTLGYVYTFDGENVDLILANPSSVTHLVTNGDYTINQAINKNAYLEEFTFADNVALQRFDVQLKKSALAGDIPSVSAYLVLAATPNVVIASARSDIGADELTTSYATKSFYFNAPQLTAGTKYAIKIVGANTSNDRTISIGYDTAGSYASHNSYMYNGTTWAVQTGLMYFGAYATKAATVDQTNYEEDILQLSYLGAHRYPDDTTEFTVSSYNNATFEVTVTGTPFTSAFIGKYAYISAGGTRIRQQRGIADSSANNKITLSSALAIDLIAGDKIQVFDKIEAQLWFPQLRKGTSDDDKKYLVSIDKNNEVRYIYSPERKRLAFWDNRVVMLAKDSQTLLFSSNIDYEIPITDKTIPLSNENVINMVPYGGYLLVFFERKVGVVKKTIIDATTQAFVYEYQDVLDIGLYSKDSFIIKAGSTLYMVANDNNFYSIKFDDSGGKISADPQDEGIAINNYLSQMVGGTVKIYYDTQKMYVVHRRTDGTSNVFKYSSFLKGWIVDDYPYAGNFFNLYRIVNAKRYTVYSNRFVEMKGLQDDGVNIKQKMQLYGPVQELMNHVTLLHTKVRIGFDGVNKIGGTITLRIGANHISKLTWDLSKLQIIDDINQDIDADGTIGSTLQGGVVWGGEGMAEIGSYDVYSEMIDISFKVGLKGSYFTIDLDNETDKQLYIGGVVPIVNGMNVNVVSNTNVLAH